MLATVPTLAQSYERVLANEAATAELAVELSRWLEPGDVVTLSGGLGAGKTTFARALIRHLGDDEGLEVPSPTFTLMQSYELPRFPILHLDLYRLGSPDELAELGFPELGDKAVTLIEWPERAGDLLPRARLDVSFELLPERGADARRARISFAGSMAERLPARLVALYQFLAEAGFEDAARIPLQGDASSRRYERLQRGGRSFILMDAPRRPDGPPMRDGKPYSALAHLAEDVTPFVALARALRERGLHAPDVYAADLAAGFLILEDFGTEGVTAHDPPAPIAERYTAALDALVALHRAETPDALHVAPSLNYHVPAYDLGALMIEAELLLDWYLPQQRRALSPEARADFVALWSEMLKAAVAAAPTWVLRDYHSPNLIWMRNLEGIARVGVLDFQDAVMGPAAYDVVSLLQDARVDVPETLEDALVSRYMKARRAADREFDLGEFVELYALMGAQRATKILGIFARLAKRDNKPQYLRHQPRVWRNLRRSLSHPTLVRLKDWYDAHVPAPRPG